MVERRKGETWNENLVFKRNLISQLVSIPSASNILLDYTVKIGTVYTATQNRSQATNRGTELSNVEDFYVDWVWYFCGEERTVTAYSPSVDGGVVIGQFTLESSFSTKPATGANPRLIYPDDIEEINQRVMRLSAEGEIQIGGDTDVGIIHNGTDGFVKYQLTNQTAQFYPLITKPIKTDSVNVANFCTVFSATASEGSDPFIEKIGIFLDSVPPNTKARIYLLGTDELNTRYPIIENVTLDQFSQGLGNDVSVSTYADTNTWNLLSMTNPTIIKRDENFNLAFSFSDKNGNPVFLDVPVDTSFTDVPFWFTVRSDNIQSASGTSITLDTNAAPRDDDYNGMRLYIGGEYRDIIDYNGTTKVATVVSVYTTPPSPSDAYDIKIAFLSPLTVIEHRNILKGKIQDKHNRRDLSYSNDGDDLEIGTVNHVDTIGGSPTFNIPVQVNRYLGGWFGIIDKEKNFDSNNVTIDFSSSDKFEGASGIDYIANEKGVRYEFRYVDDDFGWTVEKFNVLTYGEMFQIDGPNTITIGVKDVWYEIDGMSEGETNNITFQNGKELKITQTATYVASYAVSATDGVGNLYKFRLAINGVTQPKTQTSARKNNANDILFGSSNAIFNLEVDDIITLQTLNNTTADDLIILDADVNLHRITSNL